MNVQTVPPRLVHLVKCRIKTFALFGPTLRSIPLRSLLASCDNLDDVLKVLRNARTAYLPAPQRLVRS